MLETSAAYKVRINEGQDRHIVTKLDVYFDATPTSFYVTDYIVSASWLEETFAESDRPLGQISANYLDFVLNNIDQRFRPDNTTSPYAGKMVAGVKVVAYTSLEVSTDTWEELPIGTFYVGNWDASIDDPEASVACYDRLIDICNKPTPTIPVSYNITHKDLYIKLFEALGLTTADYEFDDKSYTDTMAYSFLVGNKVRDTLQALSQASFTCVYINKTNNKIRVAAYKPVGSTPVTYWADDDQISNISRPTSFVNNVQDISIAYTIPVLNNITELLNLQNIDMVAGQNVIMQTLPQPLRSITAVKLRNSSFSKVAAVSYSGYTINVTINCTTAETLTLVVEGIVISLPDLTEIVSANVGAVGKLETGNKLIQSQASALALGARVARITNVNGPYVTIECFGDPSIELLDVMSIESSIYGIAQTLVVPIRIKYMYDGALTCTMTAILYSTIN